MQPGRSTFAVGKESKAGQCIFILDFLCVNLQDRKKGFAERMTRHTPHTTHHTFRHRVDLQLSSMKENKAG